jgi:hypothetical protein
MPTVLRINGYEFFFHSNDCPEPPRIHVRGNRGAAKIWINPVSLARSSYTPIRT